MGELPLGKLIESLERHEDADEEEEEEGESMLRLMQEIKQLREVNKTLSDEERRKNAEEMIKKLSMYMNLEDDDEDYGDEVL